VLQLLFLQLDLLAGSGDVDQAPANPGDLVQHLAVGVVQHLVRILSRVERLVGFGGDDVVAREKDSTYLAVGPRRDQGRPGAAQSRDYPDR
jgi:hypothetical protein